MKTKHILAAAFSLLLSLNSLFAQPTCPNMQVTYPQGTYDGIYAVPTAAYYNDGTKPSQYKDGSNNLIVTWPHTGQGYFYVGFFDSQGNFTYNTINVNIGSQPTFTSPSLILCHSQTGTLTVSDACGSSYVWSAPSGWSLNGGGNTLTTSAKSVTLTAPASGNGAAVVSVTSDANFNGPVTTNVWLGLPDAPGPINGNTSPNIGYTETYYSAYSGSGATSYTWVMPYSSKTDPNFYPWQLLRLSTPLGVVVNVGSGQGYVQAISVNACGNGGAARLFVTPTGTPGCSPCERDGAGDPQGVLPPDIDLPTVTEMTAFPNPANDKVTVAIPWNAKEDTNVQVFDLFGKGIINGMLKRNDWKIDLSVTNCADGLYIVRVGNGDIMNVVKVMVRHD